MAQTSMLIKLQDLVTEISIHELLAEMVPPEEFASVSFSSYIPDANFPSQQDGVAKSIDFVRSIDSKGKDSTGIYLDGGFGVGKTHLLASIYHNSRRKKLYSPFIGVTSAIGYLGFAEAVQQFTKFGLLCIDEFELDDPGDTMVMSRFLKELANKGTCFAATSNTPPNALGEGRFAADAFQREIQSVADRFEIVRIDGEDYRHRGLELSFFSADLSKLAQEASVSGSRVITADLQDLLVYLGSLHQSRYAKLSEQFDVLLISNIETINDQYEGIRLVSFIDRCYEAGIALRTSGINLGEIFREDHLVGAYQKKYRRALSRLAAMCARELP